MAAHISPARRRLRLTGRVAAVLTALAIGTAALTSCAATPSAPSAAGAHDAAAEVSQAKPPVGVVVTADVPYAGTSNRQQQLDVCAPTPNGTVHPAVLLIHGGGWVSGDKSTTEAQCEWLAQSGFVTFNIDYRLAPAARYPAGSDDVTAALRFMRLPATTSRFEIDPHRIAAFGGSAGGNLATTLAVSGTGPLTSGDRVSALVDLSGPVDLTSGALTATQKQSLTNYETTYLGCKTLARCPKAAAASPLRAVTSDDPPTFIGQSSADYVPHQQGDALAAALKTAGVPVTVEQIPGAHHSFAVLTPTMKTDITAFLHANIGS
ncbi:MAG: alpha/beta hydrolase [Nocardiaceae bacterium]|nr:alpha/beta hydrolase [Nocardiaceae bacterium]